MTMKRASRRWLGLATGLVLGAVAVAWSSTHGLHRPGPMNTGHGELACDACHRGAPGTVRQQLQNTVRDALAAAAQPVDIGYRRVGNDECLACHERPEDRHPVFRFLEPRFARVREELHPEQCVSCHREHRGARVTAETTVCRHCHSDTEWKTGALEITHRALVATSQWTTCLGCHDFHGNHALEVARRLDDAIAPERVRAYFDGARSPYGVPVHSATHPGPQRKVSSR